ncbi:SIR2 family NAD-dependent protein deacylase [Francisella philomiragia]|uniref:protein acetyllysine N-acetyltransferase n=1 Tax=Francisella philomiragia TaxID=28110 RepID=A0ABS1G962_9GAMM|nr:Sir2 family NAD-dependent protein deacetylase [Francisella philomiragia]MBK2257660.1 NAD-dependent deacetylase [Francisella philomiragia]MBK2301348.1 NAD-dependent deacetylase [Francisella philomiragia]
MEYKQETISAIKDYIQQADAILIATGAGMGVDSGLPDFRGKEGFWKAYPFFEKLDIDFMDAASAQGFFSNPDVAWAFYGHRLEMYRKTNPHAGFSMLLDLVKSKNNNYFVYTSNVDGHFQKAGFDADRICEVHGSIHHLQCTMNCNDEIWNNREIIHINKEQMSVDRYPRCNSCGGIARPNILMFDDYYWVYQNSKKQEGKFNNWLHNTVIAKKQKLAIIEIGCGMSIQTIRMNNDWLVSKCLGNAKLIRINPKDSEVAPTKGWGLEMGGLEALGQILI